MKKFNYENKAWAGKKVVWRCEDWNKNEVLLLHLNHLDTQAARIGPFIRGDRRLMEASLIADASVTEHFRRQLKGKGSPGIYRVVNRVVV